VDGRANLDVLGALGDDGGQHQQRADSDRERTRFLESRGYRVLRFWNNDVFDDLESVVDAIRLELQRGPPSP